MRLARAAALAALVLAPLAACVGPQEPAPAGQCQVSDVVDGDTFGLQCAGRPAILARLAGVDAPEIARAKCVAERRRGENARSVLERLVAAGPVTGVRFTGTHADGRSLVALEIGGRDVGQAMIAAGVAQGFSDEVYPDWCAQP